MPVCLFASPYSIDYDPLWSAICLPIRLCLCPFESACLSFSALSVKLLFASKNASSIPLRYINGGELIVVVVVASSSQSQTLELDRRLWNRRVPKTFSEEKSVPWEKFHLKRMHTPLTIILCQESIIEYWIVMTVPLETYEDTWGTEGEREIGEGGRGRSRRVNSGRVGGSRPPRFWAGGSWGVADWVVGGRRLGRWGVVDGSWNFIILSYHVQEVCSKVMTFEEK